MSEIEASQPRPLDEELLSDVSAAFELEIDHHLSSANYLNLLDTIGNLTNREFDKWSDLNPQDRDQVRNWVIEELGIDVISPDQAHFLGKQTWQFPPYVHEQEQERVEVRVHKCPK